MNQAATPEKQAQLPLLWETMLAWTPEWVKKLAGNRRLLAGTAALVALLVVLPVAFAMLAGYWLKVLDEWGGSGTSGGRVAKAVRAEILAVVHEGFSLGEIVERSHRHLDYYHPISLELDPSIQAPSPIRISVEPWQRMSIRVRSVHLVANNKNCSVDKYDKLVEIQLGRAILDTLSQVDNPVLIEVSAKWWAENAEKLNGDALSQPLAFRAVNDLRQLKCAKLAIQAEVLVYKQFLRKQAPKSELQ